MVKNSIHDPDALIAGIRLALETAPDPCLLVDAEGRVLWMNGRARGQCVTPPAYVTDLGETTGAQIAAALRRLLRSSGPVYVRLFLQPDAPAIYHARRLDLADGSGGGVALFQGDRSQSLVGRFIAVQSAAKLNRDRLRRIHAEHDDLRRETARLRELVGTDALTGLLNRRGFVEAVETTLGCGRVTKGTMLFLDLDKFKPVNDRHGHAAGDAVLRATAMRLRAEVRQGDIVGRMGGDEFAIWMSGAPPGEVRKISMRIKAAVSAPLRIAGTDDWVTDLSVALGTSAWPQDAPDVAHLLDIADARMFDDKHAARQRLTGMPDAQARLSAKAS
ncbi:GGDEF domain-containing protein [Thalassococcus sp. BH17M4-6]|uniref:GGDEF domain-containing protein n=1 Tax=Thalassococcus sp. BH17M4-6 TaxID=3413148 RepID=UPI003BD8714A